MKRRAFLARTGPAVVASSAVAGCLDGILGDGTGDSDDTAGGEGTAGDGTADGDSTAAGSDADSTTTATAADSLAAAGVPSSICSAPVRSDSGIYAIDEPGFARDWAGLDLPDEYRTATDETGSLAENHTVVGVETDDSARAYPLSVLNTHEVVNDEFGGPLLVTYCPICRSGMVARRVVADEPTTFAVSGQLWRPERIQVAAAEASNRTFGAERTGGEAVGVRASGNLVVYDLATGSYWSQILAQAICGPETGERLTIRPSAVATWADWQDEHPDTEVLLPPPYSETHRPSEYAGRTPD